MKYHGPYNRPDNVDAAYVDENALLGIEGSVLPAAAAEHPQREIVHFIEDTGLIPDNNALHQLGESVQQGTVWYGDDTGTTNHLVVTLTPAPRQYLKGMAVKIKIKNNITGTCDLNVNNIGAVPVKCFQTDLVNGQILANDCVLFLYDGSVWEVISATRTIAVVPPGPIYLVAPKIWYVNAALGDDAAYDGTTATFTGSGHGPFKTIQRAATESYKYNVNGYSITIFVADGTYTGPVRFNVINGAGSLALIGNVSNPSNCQILSYPGPYVRSTLSFQEGSYECRGFRIYCGPGPIGGDSGAGVSCNDGWLYLSYMQFGFCPAYHIAAAVDGTIVCQDKITIEAGGNSGAHITAVTGQIGINDQTYSGAHPCQLVILGPVNFSVGFAWASNGKIQGLYAAGIVNKGYVSGPRYVANLLGIIYMDGQGTTYLPGSANGMTSDSSWYVV